ncbi:MAG TPA: hypothetical protein PKE25_06660 [Novosphingobium sp.]|nr:hypothetical protein [Novosphingobium sp.]
MNAMRRLSPALAALLLALVMAGRLVMPTGWMPSIGSEGIEVRLCTAQGPATMLLDLGKESPEAPRDPCPYALGTQAFALPEASARLAPLPAPASAPATPDRAAPDVTAQPRSLPPPTGPPALA